MNSEFSKSTIQDEVEDYKHPSQQTQLPKSWPHRTMDTRVCGTLLLLSMLLFAIAGCVSKRENETDEQFRARVKKEGEELGEAVGEGFHQGMNSMTEQMNGLPPGSLP